MIPQLVCTKWKKSVKRSKSANEKAGICATGGLIGMGVDHSRSSSGSLLPPGSHIRTSSGPFEQNILDSAALLSDISSPYGNRPPVSSGFHNLFNAERRENSEVDSVWNV
ncbi:hypothetical protein KIN20_009163 [Parelaphostrongylus tenuis]|uniref:Uncharacterized protein n=1 Tax=Parelaphostrongylus tenuis TaxID=148309 RepID=A0AAD5M5W9_PARTN|nr:hypothetical protein KIN20_009163 [Parelaphostrongylus tenuis]